jgi:thioredoxin
MAVVELTETTFDEGLVTDGVPVLVDVTAPWCGPCRQMDPVLEELAGEETGLLVVARVDADEHPGVARRLGVMSLPTLVVFVDGVERGRVVGARGKGRLREDLRSLLA